jgi:hypothetical protein
MFGLAHRAVLLTPAEDAFDHRPARLRHAIAFVPLPIFLPWGFGAVGTLWRTLTYAASSLGMRIRL